MKEKCDYCGQYGEGGAACGHCGAPIKLKEVAEIAYMDIKKLSAAIAKEINRKPMFSTDSDMYGFSTDSDMYGGLYQYFDTM